MPCANRQAPLVGEGRRALPRPSLPTLIVLAAMLAVGPASAQPPADSTATSPPAASASVPPPADTTAAPAPAAPALAQPSGDSAPAPMPVASSFADTTRPVLFLKELLVTGARYPRAYYESAQALSFVSRAQLREQAPTVLGDALATLPGVDMSKDSPWEQRPILRGLGGQRVLVLMDGSPVNSARGNGPHPSLVDPSQVERIEVVRGPSSVAYGSDALGGAINIITRQALPTEGARLSGSANLGGSTVDRQRNAYLELMPRIGKLSAFVSAGGRRALDYKLPKPAGSDLSAPRVPHSGFRDYNGLANLRYPITDHMTLKGSYQLYRGTDIGLPGLTADAPGVFHQEFRFPDYDRDAAHLALEHSYTDGWVAKTLARIYWQREHRNFYSHEEFDTDFLGPPPPPSEATRITNQDRFLDLDTWGFQTQFTTRKTQRYLMSAGIDLARDHTDGDNVRHRYWVDAYGTTTRTAPDLRTASVPDGTFGNYAGFVQSEWYLAPQWTVSGGGRYTRYHYRTQYGLRSEAVGAPGPGYQPAAYFSAKSVDDNALCGSLGLVYAPIPDLHLTAGVANGYREPNAQDLFFNGPASVGTVLGNPDLKPEKSVSYDLGLRWGPGDLALAGNLYYSTYDGLIDAIQVAAGVGGAPATYQYVNITKARIWGGELEGEWRFHPQYSVRVALATAIGDITNADAILQLYGVVQSRAPLPNVPPLKGNAALRWRSASGRLWVEPSARWSWRTDRLPLPTPGVPQFSTFKKEWLVGDLTVGARLPRGQRVIAGVRNIADRVYRLPVGSLDEPGRSFVGSLTVDF
jgi:hemoglobin/transferrin/lactoferrin receptor protein